MKVLHGLIRVNELCNVSYREKLVQTVLLSLLLTLTLLTNRGVHLHNNTFIRHVSFLPELFLIGFFTG